MLVIRELFPRFDFAYNVPLTTVYLRETKCIPIVNALQVGLSKLFPGS